MRFAPVTTLLAHSQRQNHRLKRELAETRERNRSLQARLGVALRERDQARNLRSIDQLPEGA